MTKPALDEPATSDFSAELSITKSAVSSLDHWMMTAHLHAIEKQVHAVAETLHSNTDHLVQHPLTNIEQVLRQEIADATRDATRHFLTAYLVGVLRLLVSLDESLASQPAVQHALSNGPYLLSLLLIPPKEEEKNNDPQSS